MQHILREHRPMVSLELGDMNVKGAASGRELVSYMINMKYRPLEYRDGTIREHTPLEVYEYDNILFLPE